MNQILFNFCFLALAIAGIAVVWRNWIVDHPHWKQFIEKILSFGRAHKVLLCGSCFTYWLALAVTLIARPLGDWGIFSLTEIAKTNWMYVALAVNIFFQWMALAWVAVFLRFTYVLIQELVSIHVHRHDSRHGAN